MFSSITENGIYKDSDKELIVELQRYHMYWYDLVVNPNEVAEYFDTRNLIVDYLRKVKKEVERDLEKRFIYFICSRKKVRFNPRRKPFYNPVTKKTKIHILVGSHGKRASIKCKFYDLHLRRFCKPKIDLTEKYITITDSRGDKITFSIHDFLEDSNISLGIGSRVEYVGYTKNPHTRPTNGSHTGLSDVLYSISDENRDSLIYFNVFKVTTRASSTNSLFNFVIASAMTHEIDAELEGKLIEKCFIFYFNSPNQKRNKDKELLEIKKNLSKISSKNKINSIHLCYEFERLNEYGILWSENIDPKHGHIFTVRNSDNGIEIREGSELFEN